MNTKWRSRIHGWLLKRKDLSKGGMLIEQYDLIINSGHRKHVQQHSYEFT